jgi:methyl-accepting chemotaxis protein
VTIARKLWIGFVLPLPLLAAVAAVSYWSTARLGEAGESVAHTHAVLSRIEALLSLVKDAESSQRGYLLTDDEAYLEPFAGASKAWRPALDELKNLTRDNPEQQRRVDQLRPMLAAKFDELAKTIRLRKDHEKTAKGDDAALALVKTNEGRTIMEGVRTITEEMRGTEDKLLGERDQRADVTTQVTRWAIGVVTGLAVVVVFLGGWFIIHSVTHPVRTAISQLTSAGAELLAGTTQQAAGARQQAAAIAQTVSTMTQISQTAEQAAERARGVGEAVQRTREVGQAGRKAVEDSIGALKTVRSQVESTAENVLALAERAQTIGDIIATVSDIAEQTNLLALNAAIEASRAGEHGRGFAVVAGEVKALADQSKKATAQVRQVLGEIQRATNTAALSTEEVTRGVAQAAQVATQAGQTIRALAEALAEAAQAASQIAASAGQQAAGVGQVQQAMTSIDQVARQNLAAIRQAEQAAQDLNRMGADFAALVGQKG